MSKKSKIQNKSTSSMKFAVILTLFVVAAFAALVVYSNNKSDTETVTNFEKQPSIEGQPVLGHADAPVTVVEFGDFKCPSCKVWGETVFQQLVTDYIDKGDVKFSYINVLFHGEESELASLAAESIYKQNPERYWDFHKQLFAAQPKVEHDTAWVTEEKLNEIAAATSDIDVAKFKEDIKSQPVIDEVKKDTEMVEDYNVQFTPSIMVNGTMLEDPFDYEKIRSLIDEALAGKQ